MPQCLRFALVCASNNNRSMEAHAVLQHAGLDASSFGVGNHVKLPGPSVNQPNIFEFGTPYEDIHRQLTKQNAELYNRNGLLPMLKRNMGVKRAPERWQDCKEQFDVALTFEERIMDQLVEDMNQREQESMRPLLVINMDVIDNRTEAGIAAPQALRLCQMIQESEDWEDSIDEIIQQFEHETGKRPFYTICFY